MCYLCCDSCLHLVRASILDNRSTSPWSCTVHTPGCTSSGGCNSPPPRMSCCWSPGEAQGDRNTQPLSPVPRYTGGCSPLWLRDTCLGVKRGQEITKTAQTLEDKVRFRNHSCILIYIKVCLSHSHMNLKGLFI